jgi:molybdopterin-guanine dinucleotide biosynthesis protein A
MNRVAGIVLCGGHSTRMGRSKAWLPISDELMLPRVVRLLSGVVSPIVVVAAAGQELPPLPPNVILTHDPEPDRGPLQGLVAGFAPLPISTGAAYVSACDVPFLQPAFVRRMIDLLGDADACVPKVDGFLHPLAAVYRRSVITVAEQTLAAGDRSLTRLCSVVRARIVTADELRDVDPQLQSLRNVNTLAEYDASLRDADDGRGEKSLPVN